MQISKESKKGTHAESQLIMASGLFEVESELQKHELEKVPTVQC